MMNNSTKDKLEHKNPHFGNTLLGAVPSVVYNEDCVEGLNAFLIITLTWLLLTLHTELEQVKCRWVTMQKRNGVKAKTGIMKRQLVNIGSNYLEYLKIKLFGEEIILNYHNKKLDSLG